MSTRRERLLERYPNKALSTGPCPLVIYRPAYIQSMLASFARDVNGKRLQDKLAIHMRLQYLYMQRTILSK